MVGKSENISGYFITILHIKNSKKLSTAPHPLKSINPVTYVVTEWTNG
jgi:hypothetical protein